jgi:GDP-4-dehydro-6-deoxy-D-mannose reductase
VALSRVKIDVAIDPALLRPNDTPVMLGNAARARNWLGWAPTRSWNTMLESVLNYWRRQP